MRRAQGRLQGLDESLQTVIDLAGISFNPLDRQRGHVARVLRMIVLAESACADEARALFEAFVSQPLVELSADPFWPATVARLAEVCLHLGDRERAALLRSPRAVRGSQRRSTQQPGLFRHRRPPPRTPRHFEAALSMDARTRSDYARMLRQRGAPDGHAHAAKLLEQARATAADLGMVRLAGEVTTLSERLAVGRRFTAGEPAARFGLSPRE
ncbi:MAG TPA: hypothetical protein VH482_04405 [Thermomicrobiales bacterium]